MFSNHCQNGEPFIIAEVGKNHNGDLEAAREYIKIFSENGANAIKFQTRNNKYLFSKDAYEAPYESENSYADTYGAHREVLELKPEWLKVLKEDCQKYGVYFMSTPFDEPSLELLADVDVDILKIASFDLGNLPFINKIIKLKKPVVLSIGGGRIEQIKSSVEMIIQSSVPAAVLHCVSEYPCEYNRLGLNNVKTLIKEFPSCVIGLSDHFNGILSGPVAYMMGARVFEKHVTLNRSLKGTDHSFALEPDGFKKFARDLKRVRHMLPPKSDSDLGNEIVFKKLGKSLIAARDISINDFFTIDNLSGKIFRKTYIPVRLSGDVIGKKAVKDIKKGDPIEFEHIDY
jgi:N-acetylneuraminate synthase/sialic acid synthase